MTTTASPRRSWKKKASVTDGRADPNQHVRAADLATLLGMDVSETPDPQDTDPTVDSDRASQFLNQLRDAHPQATSTLLEVLARCQTLGGRQSFGRASETSCFLILDADQSSASTWPLAIYPKAGTIEVVFQHMRRRPVFEDRDVCNEFRLRLQRADTVLPETKLDLRPSFPLATVADESRRAAISDALEWFAVTFHARLAQQLQEDEAPTYGDVPGPV